MWKIIQNIFMNKFPNGMKMANYQKTHMKNKNYKLCELNQLAEVRYERSQLFKKKDVCKYIPLKLIAMRNSVNEKWVFKTVPDVEQSFHS